VNTTPCERVRLAVMASLDGEGDPPSEANREHLSTCSSCEHWMKSLLSTAGRLEGLPYQGGQVDFWIAVERRIRQAEHREAHLSRLWPIAAVVLAWRVLQLSVDLPVPELQPFVALAATAAALWLVAGDPLRIETSAPELEKRGV
jgi:hypothetical protein